MFNANDFNELAKEHIEQLHTKAAEYRRISDIMKLKREQRGEKTLFEKGKALWDTVRQVFQREDQQAAPEVKRRLSTQELKALR